MNATRVQLAGKMAAVRSECLVLCGECLSLLTFRCALPRLTVCRWFESPLRVRTASAISACYSILLPELSVITR